MAQKVAFFAPAASFASPFGSVAAVCTQFVPEGVTMFVQVVASLPFPAEKWSPSF
jgi:hypothetical protein